MPNHDNQDDTDRRHEDQIRRGDRLRRVLRPFRLLLALPVWVYRKVVSPAFPSTCIYTPSCSEYTRRAILRHGLLGIVLGVFRVLRCAGGLFTGGHDEVPDRVTLRYVFGSYRVFWRGRKRS